MCIPWATIHAMKSVSSGLAEIISTFTLLLISVMIAAISFYQFVGKITKNNSKIAHLGHKKKDWQHLLMLSVLKSRECVSRLECYWAVAHATCGGDGRQKGGQGGYYHLHRNLNQSCFLHSTRLLRVYTWRGREGCRDLRLPFTSSVSLILVAEVVFAGLRVDLQHGALRRHHE